MTRSEWQRETARLADLQASLPARITRLVAMGRTDEAVALDAEALRLSQRLSLARVSFDRRQR